jgi:DNA-binding NarL/FixJ family response regulator
MGVRVLIVDDDKLLLAGMKRLLSQYDVVGAVTTEEAVDLVTRERFQAVITDYRVPTTNGVGLLQKVAEASPSTRRYLMSGNGADRFTEHVSSALVHRMFPKPLDVHALRSELATLAAPVSD